MSQTQARVEALIAAMARLRDVFRQENALLRIQDRASLPALVEHKAVLVRSYDEAARAVKVDLRNLPTIDPAVRQALTDEEKEFSTAARENALLIKAVAQVAQTKVEALVGAINRSKAEDATYTHRRGLVMPSSYGRSSVPSATLNQTL
ncbi:hypothetical protein [Oleisolibacter albus]|uniref:hypothetical protein n=1 Tax=Oleisolibacter albus TaxID=2171757 RepID=UPI000DF33A4E|nr:hypothetical protein [Oleisolibacter albus]